MRTPGKDAATQGITRRRALVAGLGTVAALTFPLRGGTPAQATASDWADATGELSRLLSAGGYFTVDARARGAGASTITWRRAGVPDAAVMVTATSSSTLTISDIALPEGQAGGLPLDTLLAARDWATNRGFSSVVASTDSPAVRQALKTRGFAPDSTDPAGARYIASLN